jgi:hypothetical protein
MGLLLAPQSLWEPLNDDAKDRVVTYLSQINDKTTDLPPNNWVCECYWARQISGYVGLSSLSRAREYQLAISRQAVFFLAD